MTHRPVRAKALLLLLALLGGGFGLPWYDALMFHSQAAGAPKAELALDNAGAAVGHNQTCALRLVTPPNAPHSAPSDLPALSARTRHVLLAPKSVLLTQTDVALGRSRAPPSLTA
jgi:zona occludens toxin (predicted ATPase)